MLSVCHCLDPMHITKNLCGNMLNTLIDIGGDIEGFTIHTPRHATLGNQEGAISHGARGWLVRTSDCVVDLEEGRKACANFFLE